MKLFWTWLWWLGLLVLPADAIIVPPPTPTVVQVQPTIVPIAAKIDPSKLLVRPKQQAPAFWSDPMSWLNVQQRSFSEKMQKAMRGIRGADGHATAWTLILLSFAYGIFHAAGPGHGKAVISTWLLANERQLRRGILISFMAAMVQALTAIILVSVVLVGVSAAGSVARNVAGLLETASYGLIALLGLYLLWQALKPKHRLALAADNAQGGHVHGADCGCDHAHMAGPGEVDGDWSVMKACSIAFAVGIRPCSGAILALLAASTLGIYWAGIVSTFVMGLGVAITVSTIAVLAVSTRNTALRLAGDKAIWLDRSAFGLKFLGGLVITIIGSLLFWNALHSTSVFA